MNRNRVFPQGVLELVGPRQPFCDADALQLLQQYRRDPSALWCPQCQSAPALAAERSTVQVIAFIEPEIDPDGFASVTEPVGNYAAAVYCHGCKRAIGILAGACS